MVEIIGLNYKYPDGTEALKDVYLDILKGESVGIIGSNGAGKSTLLMHLNGILRGQGHIRISDLDMENKNLPMIRRTVGLVFQDPDNQLFMPTVFDDVAFGPVNMNLPRNEVENSVRLALEKVSMSDAVYRSSNHLSLGEKKRVSIATVLSMNPDILVLDEPTSNLDPKSRRKIIELLKNISGTQIVASHDLEMIHEICDRVVILYNGQIVKIGPAKEIISDLSLLQKHDLIPVFPKR